MKRPRLLIVAMLAGAGLALWAASGIESGDAQPGAAALVTDRGVRPPGRFDPIVLVTAEIPADDAPVLAPPPVPEGSADAGSPSTPAGDPAIGVPASDRLQFTVMDVPPAGQARSSVVRLPPLPEPLPPGNAPVYRLPDPAQGEPAGPTSPEAGRSQDDAPLIPSTSLPSAAAPVTSPTVGSSDARRQAPSSQGPALESTQESTARTEPPATAPAAPNSPRAKSAPQGYDPLGAVTDSRPLAELLRDAGASPPDATTSEPARPKAVDASAPSTALPWSPPQLTGPSQSSHGAGHPAVADQAKPSVPPWPPASTQNAGSEKPSASAAGSAPQASPAPPWAAAPPSGAGAGLAARDPALDSGKQEKVALPPTPVSPAAERPRPPSPRAMQAVLQKADAHMQRGIDLADRRAFYSARTEFIAALRLLAQGLDAQDGGTARSDALARGIWALEEANDFIPRGSELNADIRVDRLVAAHRTTVLKSSQQGAGAAAAQVTPLQAVQKYYTYGQEQLAAAVRPSREGSQLLTALGKLYAEMSGEPARLAVDAATKGLVCQQAALLADARNARAANELGVLLAREGRFEEARDWLRHSAGLKPQSETWHNLAVVHENLGETQLAAAARTTSLTLARRQGQAAGPQVQVKQLTPAQFAGVSRPAGAAPAVASPPAAARTAAKPQADDMWDWLPWR